MKAACRLRVKRRHCRVIGACPLYPPKADIRVAHRHVCSGPIADISRPHCGSPRSGHRLARWPQVGEDSMMPYWPAIFDWHPRGTMHVVEERLYREAQSQVAHPPSANGFAQHARARCCRDQCRWPRWPRNVGIFRRGCRTSHCRFPATKQRQPKRQLSALARAHDHAADKRGDASIYSLTTKPKAWVRFPSPRARQARSVASTWRCSCAQSRRW